jgi:3-oxoacyl-[acyl-carrier protein] reductase
MDLNLKGKVAVVTGASKGIGAGIAKALAAEGVSVIVNYASSKTDADKVVEAITNAGGKATAVKASVDNASEVAQLFATAGQTYGKVDIVVNNAGVYQFAPIEGVTEDEFHRQFNINVLGPILTTQEALKYIPATGGSIINISSVASTSRTHSASVYSATKGALDTLTRVLAVELGPKNIRVNVVAPGPVETEGFVSAGVKGSEMEAQFIATTPLGRVGQPLDIANVVTFLASDASAWITAERIVTSGGLI